MRSRPPIHSVAMTPGGRRAVALLVPVALAIAAWLALRDSTSEPRAGDGGDVVPRPAAGAPSVPAPAIPSPSRALAPRGPGAERRRTPPADASRGGTEVVVTTTSGVPATPATVQVLPPAAADPDGVAEYAWAETDESGRATVREPRPGSYDLFVDWGPVRRRFRGVTLPGAERVRL